MRVIERLRINTRLLLIALMFLIPLGVLFRFYQASISGVIEFANQEKRGNAFQRPLEDLLRLLPQHNSLVMQQREARSVANEIDHAFQALLQEHKKNGDKLFSPASLAARKRDHLTAVKLAERWDRLKSDSRGADPVAGKKTHQELLNDVLLMISHAGDTSNLILDPDLDSYYLMDITLLALPQTQNRLAEILDDGAHALSSPLLTSEARTRFAVHAAQLRQNDYERIVVTDGPTALENDAAFNGTSASLQKRLPPALAAYAEPTNRFINMLTTLATDEKAVLSAGDFLAAGEKAREQSFLLWQVASQELDALLDQRISSNRNRGLLGGALTLFSLLLTGLLVLVIARSITGPLSRGVKALTALARGDLTFELPAARDKEPRDEIGQLTAAVMQVTRAQQREQQILSAMAQGRWDLEVELRSEQDSLGLALQDMIREVNLALGTVHQTVNQVHGGAEQIAQTSVSLSQQMTEQAASLEEISASVSEISAQANKSAAKAQEADQLVLNARQAAQHGSERMKELVAAMEAITAGSLAISKIIKVIDEIAFQTNLLALNAAVEAARAGQHGKGFAVVAEEVRNLAGRSAKAAQETSNLIDASGGKVRDGGRIADQTSSALTEIVTSVARMADLVSEITMSAGEQAQQVAQIRQGLDQINTATQHNTASTEESASVAEIFRDEAEKLKILLERFTLKTAMADDEPPAAHPPRRKPQLAIERGPRRRS
ncbi:MAG: hypothetical protein BWK76_20335 [Desulfobulbaceae bacterium A2]|nr:MAG: hypothetical protein BWK76_20335 [Desulfobulbaceae bacterium A2]